MKKIIKSLVIVSLLFLNACAPNTKLVGYWKDDASIPKEYNRLAVLAMFPTMSNRAITENAFFDRFTEKGIHAIPTFQLFPLAGKAKQYSEQMADTNHIVNMRNKIREKLNSNNIDAIMLITLLDVQKQERFVEGSSMSFGYPGYYGNYYGGYYSSMNPHNYTNAYSFYDYYGYHSSTLYQPGYYVEDISYFVECNLYDVATEKLIFTCQTKTVDFTDINQETAIASSLIVNELVEKGVLIP